MAAGYHAAGGWGNGLGGEKGERKKRRRPRRAASRKPTTVGKCRWGLVAIPVPRGLRGVTHSQDLNNGATVADKKIVEGAGWSCQV